MAFKRNRHMTNNIMARGLSGTSTAIFSNDQYSRNKLLHFSKLTSFPVGNRPPNSFIIAQINGGMSTRHPATSESAANMAGGKNLEAIESGFLATNNPVLDRIISLIASSSGALSVSAIMDAALLLQAYSSGIIGSDVLLGAIFSVTASSNGQSSYDVFLSALANIQAEAGGADPLSPQGLVNAMWNAILNDYQEPGSVGEALKNALASVGGGDPASIADEIMSRGVLKLGDFIALK